jgi:hypothetical protein
MSNAFDYINKVKGHCFFDIRKGLEMTFDWYLKNKEFTGIEDVKSAVRAVSILI